MKNSFKISETNIPLPIIEFAKTILKNGKKKYRVQYSNGVGINSHELFLTDDFFLFSDSPNTLYSKEEKFNILIDYDIGNMCYEMSFDFDSDIMEKVERDGWDIEYLNNPRYLKDVWKTFTLYHQNYSEEFKVLEYNCIFFKLFEIKNNFELRRKKLEYGKTKFQDPDWIALYHINDSPEDSDDRKRYIKKINKTEILVGVIPDDEEFASEKYYKYSNFYSDEYDEDDEHFEDNDTGSNIKKSNGEVVLFIHPDSKILGELRKS